MTAYCHSAGRWITHCQLDSGKPTVRDERGACENASYGIGLSGTSSGNAETEKPLLKHASAVFLPEFLSQLRGEYVFISLFSKIIEHEENRKNS